MTEADRQLAIRMRLCRAQGGVRQRFAASPMPTGFDALDAALGGGFARGAIVEVSGAESCGKTTFALDVVAHVQQRGLTAAWIDAERAFDPAYAAARGVSTERFVVAQPQSAEEALEIARRLAASMAVDLIVVDSAAALVPSLELAAPFGESGPGLQARVLASGLRGLANKTARTGAVALFLNQARSRPGADGEETTAGGSALKLYAAARIALSSSSRSRIAFRIVKNTACAAFGEGVLKRL